MGRKIYTSVSTKNKFVDLKKLKKCSYYATYNIAHAYIPMHKYASENIIITTADPVLSPSGMEKPKLFINNIEEPGSRDRRSGQF